MKGLLRAGSILLAACLFLGYSLQVATPLRLNNDAISLLGTAQSVSEGHGLPRSRFPVGYPLLVAGLDKLGLATSAILVVVNLVALAAALVAYHRIFSRRLAISPFASAAICLLSAASWVLVKHATLPITDAVFFGVSAVCLLTATRGESSTGARQAAFLLAAAILTAVAISVRTVGIALVPAVLWAGAGNRLRAAVQENPARSFWAVLAVVALLLIGYYGVAETAYFSQLLAALHRQSFGGMLAENFGWRLQELGAIIVNAPAGRVPSNFEPAFRLAWTGAHVLYLRGLWSRRDSVGSLEVFTVAYSTILLVWPFYGPRFWLAVIPPFLAFVLLGGQLLAASARLRDTAATVLLTAFCTWFLIAGGAALVYSTRISLSGNRFADRYGDGNLRDTYRAGLGQPHDPSRVDPRALRLLERFDSRFAHSAGRGPT